MDPTGEGWIGIAFKVIRKVLKATPTNDSIEQQEMNKDTDGDGINDYYDNDDDNDGIPDQLDDDPKSPSKKDNACP